MRRAAAAALVLALPLVLAACTGRSASPREVAEAFLAAGLPLQEPALFAVHAYRARPTLALEQLVAETLAAFSGGFNLRPPRYAFSVTVIAFGDIASSRRVRTEAALSRLP